MSSTDELISEIQKLKDAPLKERFPDREGGLLIPNHNIAGLKAIVTELLAYREMVENIHRVEFYFNGATVEHDGDYDAPEDYISEIPKPYSEMKCGSVLEAWLEHIFVKEQP